jgi:hypothetical protein
MDAHTLIEIAVGGCTLLGMVVTCVITIFKLGRRDALRQQEIEALKKDLTRVEGEAKSAKQKAEQAATQTGLQRAIDDLDPDNLESRMHLELEGKVMEMRNLIDAKCEQLHGRLNKVNGEAVARAQAAIDVFVSLRTEVEVIKTGMRKMNEDQEQHEENVTELLKVAAGNSERFKHLEGEQALARTKIESLATDVAGLKARRGN